MNAPMGAEQRLIHFAKMQRNVYLYGAGKYGKLCLKYLKHHHIHCQGFIQTCKNIEEYADLPIFAWDELEIVWDGRDGIILSMNPFYQSELPETLSGKSVYHMTEDDFFALGSQSLADELTLLQSHVTNIVSDNPNAWEKILVVRLDVVGDMIWTTAFLRELRRNFPHAFVTLLLRPLVRPLMEPCPYVDEIEVYDCSIDHADFEPDIEEIRCEARAFAETRLAVRNYDAVFLPRWLELGDIIENVYMMVFSGAKARIGSLDPTMPHADLFVHQARQMFTFLATDIAGKHEVERALDLLRICDLDVQDNRMELWISAKDKEFAHKLKCEQLWDRDDIIVTVGLVGRKAYRTWDAKKYADLFKRVWATYGKRVKFILMGGDDAFPSEKTIMSVAGALGNFVSIVGRTSLTEAAAVIESSSAYIGSNTGLLHMAAAFHKPILEISADFRDEKANNPVSPEHTGAWCTDSIVVRPLKGLDNCTGYCRRSYAHCINQITVEEVERSLYALMESSLK